MKNLPNIGLPIILMSILLIVFISRSSVNIGYGEAGVLFKTLGGGVETVSYTHLTLPTKRIV